MSGRWVDLFQGKRLWQDFKKLLVGMAEEIEAFVAPVILLDGIGDFSKLLNPVAGFVKGRVFLGRAIN